MQDDAFEWDDKKAEENWRKHAISFEMARQAFSDAFGVEWSDVTPQAFEERFVLLAAVEQRILVVVYAMREDRIRTISARRAEPYEQRRYHEENAP